MTTKPRPMGWVGFDLDGTLAKYDFFRGPTHIGPPIPEMIAILQQKLAAGYEVRIMTARAAGHQDQEKIITAIQKWCRQNIGVVLPITNQKDYQMVCLYDDRCVAVQQNTGKILGGVDLSNETKEP